MDGTLKEFDRLPGAMFAMRETASADTGPGGSRADGAGGDEPLVGVIRNPRSHRNRGHVPEMADRPNVITQTPRTRTDLAQVLGEFAERGIDYLVVDGGDGTVRDVLTCGLPVFGDQWPRMIFLPKGKTNALGADLGLPNRWSISDALEAARRGRLVERRPIVIDRPEGDDGQVAGFILGAGIFTKAVEVGQTAHRFGAFNWFAVALITAVSVAQAVFGIGRTSWRKVTPMRYFPGAGDREAPISPHGVAGHRYAVLISTLTRFPLGMRPFARFSGGINYALLDVPLRRAVALVPFLLRGWDHPVLLRLGAHRGTSEESVLELDDRFILDGEAFPPGRYRLRRGPQLHFVVP